MSRFLPCAASDSRVGGKVGIPLSGISTFPPPTVPVFGLGFGKTGEPLWSGLWECGNLAARFPRGVGAVGKAALWLFPRLPYPGISTVLCATLSLTPGDRITLQLRGHFHCATTRQSKANYPFGSGTFSAIPPERGEDLLQIFHLAELEQLAASLLKRGIVYSDGDEALAAVGPDAGQLLVFYRIANVHGNVLQDESVVIVEGQGCNPRKSNRGDY